MVGWAACKGLNSTRERTVIKVPAFEIDTKKLGEKKHYHHDPQDLNLIREAEIYRDDDIIVIISPGHRGSGRSKVRRHIDGLMEALCKPGEKRPKLVHRLDRETSGVLVLARNSFQLESWLEPS